MPEHRTLLKRTRFLARAITLLSILLFYSHVADSQTCGYAYSKSITIDHNNVSGGTVLKDFPLLVSVTDNDLRTVANGGNVENGNGFDIVFVDDNGVPLAHQIEKYNATSGNFIAWVKIPSLFPSVNTNITMYYGNTAVSGDPSSTQVWDNNYQAVWHLHDDFNDGTSVGNDGTNSGSTDAAGFIGDGQSFDGSNDFIFRTDANLNGNIPSLSSGSPDEFTLSGWIYIDAINVRRPLLSKQGIGPGTDRGFVFMMEDDNRLKAELFKNNVSGDRTEVYSTATLNINTWYYISMTYEFVTDGTSECYLYIDGVNDGSTTTSVGPIVANGRDLDIGRYYWNGSTNYYHDGLIDEVRISDVVRSSDWITTEFNNQSDPSTFMSFGPETGGSFQPVIPVCGSAYRKTITIDNTEVSGSTALTDFPVLISLTDNDLRTTANGGQVQNSSGYDIVFTDTNLVPYDHEIESYDETTGEYVAWVKISSLPATADLDIYMFYGNPDATVDPSTNCTWSNNFTGVYHLHDDFLDKSGNEYNGTNNGSADNTSSIIADGQDFDGTDYIELTSFPNLTTDFTITGWINTADNTRAGQRVFCDDESNSGGYALSIADGGTGEVRFFSRGMSSVILDGPNSISNNTWYYIAGVADITNQDRFIYVDGSVVASDLTDGGTWGTDNGAASIGGETASGETGNRFEGFLDEIRISTTVRSADWLTTEYNNQSDPSSFYSVGAEVALNVTSTQNGDWDLTATWAGGVIPGTGANVNIIHNVDLDDRDESICNLYLSNVNNNSVTFEVQNGQHLRVYEDVLIEGDDDTDLQDVILRLTNNDSKLTVEGNLIIDQIQGDDNRIDLENAGDSLIVKGDIIINHTSGDEVEILLDNASAVLEVQGQVLANIEAGVNNEIRIDLNSGDFIVNGTFVGSRTSGNGDINFNMDGGNFTADSVAFYTLGGGGSDNIIIQVDGASSFIVNGGMRMDMGGGDDHYIYINNNAGTDGLFEVNGDFIWNKTGGDDAIIIVDDVNSEFHVTGDFIWRSTGAEEIDLNLDNGNFNVDNDFLIIETNNQIDILHIDMDGGTITVGDSMVLTHTGNANNDLLLDLDAASVVNANYLVLTLNGNSGNEELLVHIDGTSQINVTADLLAVATDGNDMEIHLGQNSAGSTAQLNVGGNLTLDHNGASGVDDIQFIISDDAQVDVSGSFTMETTGSTGAGNFYTQMNNNAVLSVDGDIVMDNNTGSGYLEIAMNNNSLLQIGGNFVRNASPNNYGLVSSSAATTAIEYNGSTAQVFADEDGAGTDGIEYELVIINNTFGTEPQLTMEAAVTLSNNITFTDGVLQTTSANLLSIDDNATATIGSDDSYVNGPLQKIGDDNFIFPVGDSGIWAPIAISDLQNGPAATDAYTAEYFKDTYSESFLDSLSYGGDPGGMYNTSIREYWDLTRDNGTAQPKVTLYWGDNTRSVITDTMDLVVAHYLGGNTWANEGGFAFGNLAAGNVRSENNITSFSVFTFGSTSSSVNALPIILSDFSVQENGDVVDIRWITESEINNEKFIIERSVDARNFEQIKVVPGAGNSREPRHYFDVDAQPLPGISYYRLKQVDFNGLHSHSQIEAVNRSSEGEFFVFPNPVFENTIYFSEPCQGVFYHLTGKEVLRISTSESVDLSGFAKGVYYFKPEGKMVQKIVIE
ncbi:MAG: DUF2341 domain-containing protein [Vicingaceae bacterium]